MADVEQKSSVKEVRAITVENLLIRSVVKVSVSDGLEVVIFFLRSVAAPVPPLRRGLSEKRSVSHSGLHQAQLLSFYVYQ